MSIPNEYKEVCEMLLDATNRGQVRWVMKKMRSEFIVRLPGFSVVIWGGYDDQRQKKFVAMGLRRPDREPSLSPAMYDNWVLEEDEEGFSTLDALYGAARRQAHRVPEKLETLRELLKSGAKVGFD